MVISENGKRVKDKIMKVKKNIIHRSIISNTKYNSCDRKIICHRKVVQRNNSNLNSRSKREREKKDERDKPLLFKRHKVVRFQLCVEIKKLHDIKIQEIIWKSTTIRSPVRRENGKRK